MSNKNNLQKYPITYCGSLYTVILKHHPEHWCDDGWGGSIIPEYYTITIYKGEKKWNSRSVFKLNLDVEEKTTETVPDEELPVTFATRYSCKDLVKKAFERYQNEVLDKEDRSFKEKREFEEWDGNLDAIYTTKEC